MGVKMSAGFAGETICVPADRKCVDPSTSLCSARDDRLFSAEEPPCFVGCCALPHCHLERSREILALMGGEGVVGSSALPHCHLERSPEIHAPPGGKVSVASAGGTICVPTAGKCVDPSTPLRCARDERSFLRQNQRPASVCRAVGWLRGTPLLVISSVVERSWHFRALKCPLVPVLPSGPYRQEA